MGAQGVTVMGTKRAVIESSRTSGVGWAGGCGCQSDEAERRDSLKDLDGN